MKYLLITIKHKWFVFCAGLRLGVPLCLLILHDWSKFTLTELPHYQRQFFGTADQPDKFSVAWLHHQHHNKHHWEHWIPITGHNRGGNGDLIPIRMPEKYVREMVADWYGASRAYEGRWPGKSWPWWEKNQDKIFSRLHPDTAEYVMSLVKGVSRWNG